MDRYKRHELGQNFLADARLIAEVQRLVRTETSGPVIELGAGDGALTRPLARLDRPLTALEIDPRRARRLALNVRPDRAADTEAKVEIVCADFLRYRFPDTPHTIVGNIPFHLTTAVIRRLLAGHAWTSAVLIVQWEVARRRAGVGGASMLTATWWPWYEFRLVRRIPAASFQPVPSVDAGLITMRRRPFPLVTEQRAYQAFVRQVFQSPGRGLAEMILRTGRVRRADLHAWLRRNHVPSRALPKDLTAEQWAELWTLVRPAPMP
ncbi:MAG TPA: 23S ribosomal RNA methyltransferase Erm [Actinocrinis sp.]|jgi:23S rRNA (adenine-N6)-dimethyltransferase|uniref:23S ribosomal RNA methyltransferase Erm n=1 Tax=Actinocrinis sp. TaxID=1920516 RepID=UPI002DDD756D|nr:23S ribosomal RNA methyltransferase Erm [Actinocrinis sp.]HEV3172358.1 23S ribosomal RNA methyltransferase Erm [Actinocrinis sp.]